jgi:hypothetical protein
MLGVTSKTLANNGGVVDASFEPWSTNELMKTASLAIASKQFSMIVLDLEDGNCTHPNTQWLPPDFLCYYHLGSILNEPKRTLFRRRKEGTPGCIFVPNN